MNENQKKIHQIIVQSRLFDERYYLSRYPDIAEAKMDALEHYVVAGDEEGREPNIYFRPQWYRGQLETSVRKLNTLVHYLLSGDKGNLQPIPGFDPLYVRSQVERRDATALHSFIAAKSFRVHINPNEFFDYQFYVKSSEDLKALRMDAYLHFIDYGVDENRMPCAGFNWSYIREKFNLSGTNKNVYQALMLNWRRSNWADNKTQPTINMVFEEVRQNHLQAAEYEERPLECNRVDSLPAEIYAFYLPQFHRIEENDRWWGKGFTEWHNVVRGLPRFKGHYQPRIPSELGFYDLDDPQVMSRQVSMARHAGITGFAFYFYHFGHQRLLEKPLDQFRQNKALDLGYFLIWANETWSRRWDGSDKEILIEQTYPSGLVMALADDFALYMRDPRYKTIDGRPLLVIYRVSDLPKTASFIKNLRAAFHQKGLNPLIYMAQSFDDLDHTHHGLDGSMEFPPHKISKGMSSIRPERSYELVRELRVFNYDHFVEKSLSEPYQPNLIKTCFPSWDNDGRRQGASSVVDGSTPAKFEYWLGKLAERIQENKGANGNLVCINAWNEWGEGAYLEPDRRYGFAYLNAVQRVKFSTRGPSVRVVLVGHDAFPSGAQRLLMNIGKSLVEKFHMEVVFLLLDTKPGYDALVPQYAAIAPTVRLAGTDTKFLDQSLAQLAAEGYRHAFINTAASMHVLPMFQKGWKTTLLVHELGNVLAAINARSTLRDKFEMASNIVVPTETLGKLLHQAYAVAETRVTTLPQGVHRTFRQIDSQANKKRFLARMSRRAMPSVVISIGYADIRKGADLFVNVCAAMAHEDDFVFIWQGNWDPETSQSMAQKVDSLIAQGKLILVPDHEAIEEVMDIADVYFLASREDPFPSVALEAWAMGLPVMAIAGAGGISELIAENPGLGELSSADTGQCVSTLQNMVRTMVSADRAQREAFCRSKFNWDAYVAQILLRLYGRKDIAVYIVAHNQVEFADQRVDGILHQTLPPASITYCDMGSTKEECHRLDAITRNWSSRLSVMKCPPNHGRLYQTWLSLARQSTAEYLLIAEGDDDSDPNFLDWTSRALDENVTAAYAFSAVRWIDANNRVLNISHKTYVIDSFDVPDFKGGFLASKTILGSGLAIKNPILNISSVLWRRSALLSILEAAQENLSNLNFAFDWYLYAMAAYKGWGLYFVPAALTSHRQHARSLSRVGLSRHIAEISTVHEMLKEIGFPNSPASRSRYLDELRNSA